MKASLKRIVWALGWYFVWVLNDWMLVYATGETGGGVYQAFMLLIWVIPLLFFIDDVEK